MCRNDHQENILTFPEDTMAVDEDDLENQDPSEVAKPGGDLVESFSRIVAPEDMLVVPKDESVGEEVISSPQCSYEEIVHRDAQHEEGGGERGILFILTQWTLTLQEVYSERMMNADGFKNLPGTKCVCSKTSLLTKDLEGLQNRLTEKRFTFPQGGSEYTSEERELDRIQTMIKTHISIQISRPSEDTVFEARRLVQTLEEPGIYLSTLIRNLMGIIRDLLPCGSGRHFECTEGDTFLGGEGGVMEQDEEEDMSLRVASMSTSPSKSRKRKQAIKALKSSPPNSPSSPSKKPRKGDEQASSPLFRVRPFHKTSATADNKNSPVIDILEKNKKMAKTNGLYQFVLWREALKAEKDRVIVASPAKGHHKRLSFDL